MKNMTKIFGIIAFVAVIGFSLESCTIKCQGDCYTKSNGSGSACDASDCVSAKELASSTGKDTSCNCK